METASELTASELVEQINQILLELAATLAAPPQPSYSPPSKAACFYWYDKIVRFLSVSPLRGEVNRWVLTVASSSLKEYGRHKHPSLSELEDAVASIRQIKVEHFPPSLWRGEVFKEWVCLMAKIPVRSGKPSSIPQIKKPKIGEVTPIFGSSSQLIGYETITKSKEYWDRRWIKFYFAPPHNHPQFHILSQDKHGKWNTEPRPNVQSLASVSHLLNGIPPLHASSLFQAIARHWAGTKFANLAPTVAKFCNKCYSSDLDMDKIVDAVLASKYKDYPDWEKVEDILENILLAKEESCRPNSN